MYLSLFASNSFCLNGCFKYLIAQITPTPSTELIFTSVKLSPLFQQQNNYHKVTKTIYNLML